MLEINNSNYQEEIDNYNGVLMIDFWAPWCGPCQMSGPIVEEIGKLMEGKAKIAKINIDENQDIASKFGVMSIPTFVFMKNGKEKDRKIGLQSKEEIETKINDLLSE